MIDRSRCAAGSQRLSFYAGSEREVRLETWSQWLFSETTREREAWLKTLRHNQSQRLSSEISGI